MSGKMSRTITQSTFDDAVRENVEEFEMTEEEAIEDAAKQFEAQGVDLSNIIKDFAMTTTVDTQNLKTAIRKLDNYRKLKSTKVRGISDQLNAVLTECNKGMPQRLLAGKENAYAIILELMMVHDEDKQFLILSLTTLVSLMTGQPDLLDELGINVMIKYLDEISDAEVLHLLLRWIKECCIKHEQNRQNIFNAAILNHLKPMLKSASSQLLRDICAVLRALVLDDDIRVEFGKAHEHARVIASDTLCSITDLLTKYKGDEAVVNDLMLTLSALIVRNEFCRKVEDAGGLIFLLEVLKDFNENEKLNRQALKLLKVLAGNDDCKSHIVEGGGAQLIVYSLATHKQSAQTVAIGFNCVAALTLRSPVNSKLLFEAGLPEIIVDCMRLHPNDIIVQKSASWAIRNMVSRSNYQNEKFLLLGVEHILQENLKKFKTDCEYDIKSALRDLGCNVELREEWTGRGGMITTQFRNK